MPTLNESRLEAKQLLAQALGHKARLLASGELPRDPRLWNEAIGLPIHPATNKPTSLYQYQLDILNTMTQRRYHEGLIVKSNKIGITETILRGLAMNGVPGGPYAGYQILMGSHREEISIENMRRLHELFRNSDRLSTYIEDDRSSSRLKLTNATEYIEVPGSASSMRSWYRVIAVFLDEAAHYGLINDDEVLAAAISRLANTNGDLWAVSTPKGQRGWFHGRVRQVEQGTVNAWKREYPYHVSLDKLISREFIEDRAKTLGPLFAQEFEAQFITTQQAAISESIIEGAFEEFDSGVIE